MSLGQLSDYKSALKYYLKGIELFQKELNAINDNEKRNKINDSISSAYASLAELYMNTPLCDDKNAEKKCEDYLNKGIQYNPNSLDVLLQLSNLRIIRCRDDEALEYMERIYKNILACLESGSVEFPSEDILSNLAKNYSELEKYNKAIRLYDILIKMNDENVKFILFRSSIGISWLSIILNFIIINTL
jgi:tetratricopeptide (TPR) repeat protein